MNDYLRDFLVAGGSERPGGFLRAMSALDTETLIRRLHEKDRLRSTYAYAIPTDEAIAACVKYSPIVEIGAGLGYWAKLITEAGGDVVAYDKAPGYRFIDGKPATPWFDVQAGDALKAVTHPDRTLFLCWPPYADPMAHDALLAYRGTRLIYIGEWGGGCTADDAFHDELATWRLVEDIRLPQHDGLHDSMRAYER